MKQVLFLIFVLLTSCNNEKKYAYTYYNNGNVYEKIELNKDNYTPDGKYLCFYESGKLKIEANIITGRMNGIKKIFYENGQVNSIINIKNDKENGLSISYHKNGNIALKENYKNGLYYGKQLRYFELDSGKVEEEANYLIVKGKFIQTMFKKYDVNGNLVEQSRHIETSHTLDTLNMGDSTTIQVKMINPRFDRMDVWLANYDEEFYCDSTTLDSIPAKNHIANVPIIAKDTGWQYLRGYVDDYELHYTDSGTGALSTLNNYFEYKYYVRQ